MQNLYINNELIAKATQWWANDLRNPSFIDDKPLAPLINESIQRQNELRENLTKRQEVLFKIYLTNSLREVLSKQDKIILSVDYDPSSILKNALEQINSKRSLSWKTEMEITKDSVKVSKGFGCPYEVIYQKDKTLKK